MVDEDRIMSSFTDIKDDFLSRPFNQEVCEGIKVKLATHLRLDQMSTRSGGRAGQIYYITGHQAINYANEVFGFNGWRSELLECIVHHCEKSESGRWECLAIARMRITIRGGSFREDAGSAKAIAKTKLEVLENAQKSASTDAMKRCLRQSSDTKKKASTTIIIHLSCFGSSNGTELVLCFSFAEPINLKK
eukprot:484978_1